MWAHVEATDDASCEVASPEPVGERKERGIALHLASLGDLTPLHRPSVSSTDVIRQHGALWFTGVRECRAEAGIDRTRGPMMYVQDESGIGKYTRELLGAGRAPDHLRVRKILHPHLYAMVIDPRAPHLENRAVLDPDGELHSGEAPSYAADVGAALQPVLRHQPRNQVEHRAVVNGIREVTLAGGESGQVRSDVDLDVPTLVNDPLYPCRGAASMEPLAKARSHRISDHLAQAGARCRAASHLATSHLLGGCDDPPSAAGAFPVVMLDAKRALSFLRTVDRSARLTACR